MNTVHYVPYNSKKLFYPRTQIVCGIFFLSNLGISRPRVLQKEQQFIYFSIKHKEVVEYIPLTKNWQNNLIC